MAPQGRYCGAFARTSARVRELVTQTVQRSRILGTGHYLPEQVLTNAELAERVDTSDDWIQSRTGIKQRHVAAPDEASSDMAAKAAARAIEAAGLAATDIDLIVVATVTPDMQLPATAVFVQQTLGCRPNCPAFDLGAACAGFIYGLSVADAYVRSGLARNVLVIGVELLTRIVNWEDRSTCVLFGDGAGAVVIGPSDNVEQGILSTHIYADGSQAESLCIPAGGTRTPLTTELFEQKKHLVHMVGKEVFKYAVKALTSSALEAIESNGLTRDDIAWLIPHQANIRIIDAVIARSGIPKERCYINIETTANTSSASVPIALDQAVRSGAIEPGQNLVFCALGGGFAWGSALVRW
jgi:3-oxoacyl-[acyl-carrier-protein] synthase-3